MPSSQRVYVGNIGSDIRERDLEKFFKGFGKIGDIAVKNGYGFVDFDAVGMEEANKLFVPLACFKVSPSEFVGHPKLDEVVFTVSFGILLLAHGSIPKSYCPGSLAFFELFCDELLCPNISRVKMKQNNGKFHRQCFLTHICP